jgi:hypothetical protein
MCADEAASSPLTNHVTTKPSPWSVEDSVARLSAVVADFARRSGSRQRHFRESRLGELAKARSKAAAIAAQAGRPGPARYQTGTSGSARPCQPVFQPSRLRTD